MNCARVKPFLFVNTVQCIQHTFDLQNIYLQVFFDATNNILILSHYTEQEKKKKRRRIKKIKKNKDI